MNLGWIWGFQDIQEQESFHPNSVPDSNSNIRKGISDMSRTKLTRSKSPEAKGKDREINLAWSLKHHSVAAWTTKNPQPSSTDRSASVLANGTHQGEWLNEPRCWICEFRDIQEQETFHPWLVPDSNSVNRKGISDMSKTKLTQSKSPEAKGT